MIRAVYFSFCTATVKKATESFSIPRLASSILICRKNPLLIAPYDYEVLLLKRMSQRSFANALAFPGGRVEEADITNTAKT
jgi:8-oxo-dGTP pyrophosphatase MutT (NUDIX family)